MEKAREFQKNMYFCFIDYAKAFDCVDHNKLWKVLKEIRTLLLTVMATPFQILYDYTVEVRNRFKGLDLIDRVPDELWTILKEMGMQTT